MGRSSRIKFMVNHKLSPTPYSEVNRVLDVLLPQIQAILGQHFIGMYLVGSLASGDFDLHSDVDFVVVTDTELRAPLFSALQTMHARIAKMDSWCATQLEGSYIPRQALMQYDPQRALYLHIDRGQEEQLNKMQIEDSVLSRAWWGGWVILRSNLRDRGITLAGPAPHTLIDPVPVEELRQATLAVLHGWAEPILTDTARIDSRGYQCYIVLTLCRMLYTLQYGTLVSKPVAAQWARAALNEPWASLIDKAWAGRQDPQSEMQPEDISATLGFIRYTLNHNVGKGLINETKSA